MKLNISERAGGRPSIRSRISLVSSTGLAGAARQLQRNQGAEFLERKAWLVKGDHALGAIFKDNEDRVANTMAPVTFEAGEYLFRQGSQERMFYLIESGDVCLTRKERVEGEEKVSENQIGSRGPNELAGEEVFVFNMPRTHGAYATTQVKAMRVLPQKLGRLHTALHDLLHYRHVLKAKQTLKKFSIFSTMDTMQLQMLLDRTSLQHFQPEEYLCRQGEFGDTFFVIVHGTAKVVVHSGNLLIDVARKYEYESIGDIALLGKHQRTADVIAIDQVSCIVIRREDYVNIEQMDNVWQEGKDDEILKLMVVNSFRDEWNISQNLSNLGITEKNPKLIHGVARAISKFRKLRTKKKKREYGGQSMFLDLIRRVQQDSSCTQEFPSIARDIEWENVASALYSTFSAIRKITSKSLMDRSSEEKAFVSYFIESATLLDMFLLNPEGDRRASAKLISPLLKFQRVKKGETILEQNRAASRTYIVCSGIVQEIYTSTGRNGQQFDTLGTMRYGDCFGELSLIAHLRCLGSAIAISETDLVYIEREDFVNYIQYCDIRHPLALRANFLKKLSYFRNTNDEMQLHAAAFMQPVYLRAQTIVCREGVTSEYVYVIVSGEVSVLRQHSVENPYGDMKQKLIHLSTLCEGEAFGLSAVSTAADAVEEFTYMCATILEVLVIHPSHWTRFHPSITATMEDNDRRRGLHELELDGRIDQSFRYCQVEAPAESRLHRGVDGKIQSTKGEKPVAKRNFWHELATKKAGEERKSEKPVDIGPTATPFHAEEKKRQRVVPDLSSGRKKTQRGLPTPGRKRMSSVYFGSFKPINFLTKLSAITPEEELESDEDPEEEADKFEVGDDIFNGDSNIPHSIVEDPDNSTPENSKDSDVVADAEEGQVVERTPIEALVDIESIDYYGANIDVVAMWKYDRRQEDNLNL